jgi:uncharacterized protein (TIGR02145 family)
MKKKTFIFCFAIVSSFLLFTFPVKLYALNYTISFTGTGASTSVESVVVQNLTKGTTVTVPTGNVLILSDVDTSIDKTTEATNGITIYPNPIKSKSTVTFFAKKAGTSQINVFGIDGKRIIGLSSLLTQGNNSFQLSLPKGIYSFQVHGNGFSYNLKVISQIISNSKPQINFIGENNSSIKIQQKSKSSGTNMLYSNGDQLLYKGISGNYSTIITDVPTSSKTTNFIFTVCSDVDGNNYTTVTIGTQIWMAENLKTSKYNDGTSIPNIIDVNTWCSLNTGAYCTYDNTQSNNNTYGKFYNFYAVIDSRKISPNGWHVPSDAEWKILENYLGGITVAGGKLKETGFNHWKSPNTGANNISGFTALPAGYRWDRGSIQDINYFTRFWASTEVNSGYAWSRSLTRTNVNIIVDSPFKYNGFSVRCVKD